MSATPLFSQAIHGVRAWEVHEDRRDGPLIAGWAVSHVWPPGEPLRATCGGWRHRRPRSRAGGPHLAPHPDCGCGIYAFHPGRLDARRELLDKLARCEAGGVLGAIAAWGRVEVHAQGFRAEWARPVRFYATGKTGEVDRATIARLARAYGAEVVELGGSRGLADAFATLGGLGRGTVRRLLREQPPRTVPLEAGEPWF